MNNVETFLDLYRTLEEDLKEFYSGRRIRSSSAVFEYMNEEGRRHYDEIDVCREIRNLLSHHPSVGGKTPVEPSDTLIETLRRIIFEIENPIVASAIATKREDIVTATHDDSVPSVLKKMDERGISHVPVINSGRMTGVFSIGALFEFIRRHDGIVIDEDLKISDVSDFLPVGAHRTEQYLFCEPKTRLDELGRMFRCTGPRQRRVAAIFVMRGEDRRSELLGMITPWDVIKAQSN